MAKRQKLQASLPLPPPPPQHPNPVNGAPGQGHYQNRPSGGHHQRSYAPQQPQQQQHVSHGPSSSWHQQPQPQQHGWVSQAPVHFPGHKAAGGWGRPVYSAPYTEPYYAAQYGTSQHQRPPPQQQQQHSWQAGPASGQHSRPAQYSGSQAAVQSARPAGYQNHQESGHAGIPERVDPRQHLAAYKDRDGSANSSGSGRPAQNGWAPKQEYHPAYQQGHGQYVGQQAQGQPAHAQYPPVQSQIWHNRQEQQR